MLALILNFINKSIPTIFKEERNKKVNEMKMFLVNRRHVYKSEYYLFMKGRQNRLSKSRRKIEARLRNLEEREELERRKNGCNSRKWPLQTRRKNHVSLLSSNFSNKKKSKKNDLISNWKNRDIRVGRWWVCAYCASRRC